MQYCFLWVDFSSRLVSSMASIITTIIVFITMLCDNFTVSIGLGFIT